MYYVGVDGCKRECWAAVILGVEDSAEVRVFRDIFALWQACRSASLILVDIPIGLRDFGNQERLCDKEARKKLGRKRGRSVFPAPCRAALKAGTYEEASEINRQRTGRKLPKQTRAILPKIREVEELITSDREARARIRESHPEVCFWALAGSPMQSKKRILEGHEERIRVLQRFYPGCARMVEEWRRNLRRKSGVSKTDLLDAFVLAVSASRARYGFKTLPAEPEVDSRGLPMEMVYTLLPDHIER
ncbi:MAG TPA: DUF429 domain-containing protein [Desulfotomaculum sp.]|nr:DUF429 domain-containing protein [Desulfotomaculum sp.]